ncbi:MAG: ribosome recycling factor [Alphaproteobacteria bacterium]|nr:ribosome recycling factor [Alphaproteobacteria bacterium]MBT5389935.1 ribosome recycling factor [Alphaproteobacteria bacterium]MBT5540336.1 ribosome recycling factor [Alphaproteobacteria bacterium]MBT5655119.1 ribosome recycling factor [Alphaproteobacteria bacterium]
MGATENIADLKRRMEKSVEALRKEFSGLRAGRASMSLLEPVSVEGYGSKLPIDQVGTIGIPESRLITVQVWDQTLVKNVEKAIRDAGLGLNPVAEGNLVRIPLPDLSEERRKELVKVAAKYSEQARISIRNVRRDGMDSLKRLEKEGELSEDELHRLSGEVQNLTDLHIKQVDESLHKKENEILQR